jgi:hypothetical protein
VDGSEGVSPMRLDVAQVRADAKVDLPQPPAQQPVPVPQLPANIQPQVQFAPQPVGQQPSGVPVVSGTPTQPYPAGTGAVAPVAVEQPKKRTRRTKAQIEAEKNAVAGVGGGAPAVADSPASSEKGTNGFIIVKGGVLGRGTVGESMTISELFDHYAAEIIAEKIEQKAAQVGSSYYDLDPFRRKEYLQTIGEHIANDIDKEFGVDFIFVDTINPMPDVRAFMDAILPYAAGVIHAITV